jgi:hypothetical protein
MNRTREMVQPSEALKLICDTLNNPSIKHERIEMKDVYQATAEALQGRAHKPLSITKRGVIVEGLIDVLACVHAWRAVPFDIARGVKGIRVYDRRVTQGTDEFDHDAIQHEVQLPKRRGRPPKNAQRSAHGNA